MKSLSQRLQSRISLRRNEINAIEMNILYLKCNGAYLEAAILRSIATDLAKDQKLDKELYVMVLKREANIRFYEQFGEALHQP